MSSHGGAVAWHGPEHIGPLARIPCMSTTVQDMAIISAQVPKSVYDELVRRAVEADRSISAQVRRILVRHLDDGTEEDA